MRVFAFLDLEHPAVAWAVMRGMIVSADHAFNPPHPGFISFMQAGMIEHQNNARIFNEAIIEQVRAKKFTGAVSRLRGIYFFQSRSEAEARIGDKHWPPYFGIENLLELELTPSAPPTVVDANWITYAPLSGNGRIPLEDLNWIDRYWNKQTYNKAPVWEVLANGIAVILDEAQRRKCFSYVKELFPECHIMILMARLASEAGSLGGLTSPFLLRGDDQNVELSYLFRDKEFHNHNVIEKIFDHPDGRALARMMAERETWKVPDFRPWGRVYRFGTQALKGIDENSIPSVHHS